MLVNLTVSFKKPLVAIGCGAHIIHNALESAHDLPWSCESIIEFCVEAEKTLMSALEGVLKI